MKLKQWYKKTFNYKSTERSADTLLLTLILSGWFVSLAVYLMVK